MTAFALISLSIGLSAPPFAQKEPTRPTGEIQTLDELVNAYRWYGLPILSDVVHVVRWEQEKGFILQPDGERTREKTIHLGFKTRQADSAGPATVWEKGYSWPERRVSRLAPIKPTLACLEGLKSWSTEDYISLAVHCHVYGWDDLAGAALAKARTAARDGEYPPEFKTPEERKVYVINTLRKMAWDRTYDSLFEKGSDRKKALEVMQGVYSADDPVYIRGEYSDDLIADLKAALQPVTTTAGSKEFLIDQLIETDFGPDRGQFGKEHFQFGMIEETDPIVKIAERGFDAVPTVIAHLTDSRVARSPLAYGTNNGVSTGLARIRETCSAYLGKLSDGAIRGDKSVELNDAYVASCVEWFERAKLVGEERWAMEHVAPDGKRRYGYNPILLRLIRAKYPHRLVELYTAALSNRKAHDSTDLAVNLALSRLDRATKFRLLRQGVGHSHPDHRLAAIHALALLDRSEHVVAVKEAFGGFRTIKDVLRNRSRFAEDLTQRCLVLNDGRCWAAFRSFLRTVESDVRCEVISYLAVRTSRDSEHFRPVVDILLVYSSEPTDHDFVNPAGVPRFGGFEYPKLTLGNYCALQLAEMFEIDVPWNTDRTPAEWAALREKLQAAVEKELAAGKK